MRFGLSIARSKILRAASLVAGGGALLLQMTQGMTEAAVLPIWVAWSLGGLALGGGITAEVMRRRHGMYSNVVGVSIGDRSIDVEYAGNLLVKQHVMVADIYDIRLLDVPRHWLDRMFITHRQPMIRIRYRDRHAKVLYAHAEIGVRALWVPDMVEYLLSARDLTWYIERDRIDDHEIIRQWVRERVGGGIGDLGTKVQLSLDQQG